MRPDLIIVSPCSEAFRPIGKLTESSKRAFGERWNIPVIFPDYPRSAYEDHGWIRIDIMQEHLVKANWMLFLGADVILTNHRIDARYFIDKDSDIVVAFDENGLQSDVLFLRNCPEVHAMLNLVRERRSTDFDLPWLAGSEQGCMVRTLAGLPAYVNGLLCAELQKGGCRVKEAPKTINRYLNDFNWGDWCFHAAAMPMEERIKWLTAFGKQIIN